MTVPHGAVVVHPAELANLQAPQNTSTHRVFKRQHETAMDGRPTLYARVRGYLGIKTAQDCKGLGNNQGDNLVTGQS